MTTEPLRTVPAVLKRFDTTFSAFASAFYDGEYVLWLGSGISRDRVPNVYELLENLIESVRTKINQDDDSCEYEAALDKILSKASLTKEEMASLDLTVRFADWPLRDRITGVLADRYSKVLAVRVGSREPDYLLWDVIKVAETFGSPAIEPDVEHLCIALLIREGLVDTAVTTNWDGLVEKALASLMPSYDALARVIVKPQDFQLAKRPVEYLKFHGCAVLARSDSSYRPLLIARQSQISKWASLPAHRPMRKRLESLYSTRRTLMVGLSAQDANLQFVFGEAVEDLARPWSETEAPAVVLSEETLHDHHENVLEITYGDDYDTNAEAICDSTVLGSFGKPTLLALVLATLTHKLTFLLEQLLTGWDALEVDQLKTDLAGLRDSVADQADPAGRDALSHQEIVKFQRYFIARLIDVTNMAMSMFRTGHGPTPTDGRYEPLSERPITQAVLNADFPSGPFGRLGVALALIGRGHTSGHWSAIPGNSTVPSNGVLRIISARSDARVFFVKDAKALTELELSDSFDDADEMNLVVVADDEPRASTRSPRASFGRSGRATASRFNVARSVAETNSADELYEAFRFAGGF